MWDSIWESVLFAILITVLFTLYFVFRKPKSFDSVAKHNRTTFTADGNPKDVLNAVIAFARNSKYRLGETDDARRTVVIEEPLSIFNYGALFQIAVQPDAPGRSVIHVATVGRGYQWGPAFQRSKRSFLEALQAAMAGRRAAA